MTTWEKLICIKETKGAGYFVLIDPDKQSAEDSAKFAAQAEKEEVDGIFVGGSLLSTPLFDLVVKQIKAQVTIPVIIFPGGVQQISSYADALLFMSVISGRNADLLIGRHVMAAPIIKMMGLETIALAYMLIESGKVSSAEFMSNTRPIPRDKADIAVAHALAAQYLGMKMIYLEAGSGAPLPVPNEMIASVCSMCQLPIVVGGGITTPEAARQKVDAGASFIVTGSILEQNNLNGKMAEFARAIHKY